MSFGALRAPWDYNTDSFDRRDVGQEEILGLLLSKPLVSDGKRRLREAVSQAFWGRMQRLLFALHLVVCLELLSRSVPFLSNSGESHAIGLSPLNSPLCPTLLPLLEETPPTLPPTGAPAPTAQALRPVSFVLLLVQPQNQGPGDI